MTKNDDVPENYASLDEIETPPSIQGAGVEQAAQDLDHSSHQHYVIPDEYANLDELAGPLPVENPHEEGLCHHHDLEEFRSKEQEEIQDRQPVSLQSDEEDKEDSHEYANLDELAGPPPDENPDERQSYRHHDLEEARTNEQHFERRESRQGQNGQPSAHDEKEPPQKTRERKLHRMIFHLYVTSYLILFSILGTLARLGLQALTIYPGSPVAISELWANVGGSLIMGFLSEDRTLFHNEWEIAKKRARQRLQLDRETSEKEEADEEAILAAARKEHGTEKKTIPGFIGLAVGFCGCFTSFSSFMRDAFYALSNHLDTSAYTDNETVIGTMAPRDDGNSVMAVLAVLIIEICLCLSAVELGAHIAIALEPIVSKAPRLNIRRITDPMVILVAWGSWVGAVVMFIWPPDRPSGPAADGRTTWAEETWRGDVLFALALAPLGCLLRFHASLKFNGLISHFPLGTFIVNIAGTIILGACWDLQRAPLTNGAIGGGRIGCQVLQGVQDGFCGSLTTVSTWVIELKGLQRKHAYFYGAMSVAVGLCSLVVIMGTFVWEEGNRPQLCSV